MTDQQPSGGQQPPKPELTAERPDPLASVFLRLGDVVRYKEHHRYNAGVDEEVRHYRSRVSLLRLAVLRLAVLLLTVLFLTGLTLGLIIKLGARLLGRG